MDFVITYLFLFAILLFINLVEHVAMTVYVCPLYVIFDIRINNKTLLNWTKIQVNSKKQMSYKPAKFLIF